LINGPQLASEEQECCRGFVC